MLYLQIQRATDNLCKPFMRSGVKEEFAGHERRHWNWQKTDEAAYLWQLNWSGCSQDAPLHGTVALTLREMHRAWEQSKRCTAAGREEITTLRLTLLFGPCTSELLVLTTVWRACRSAWCHCAQRSAVQVQTCPTCDFVVDLVLLF